MNDAKRTSPTTVFAPMLLQKDGLVAIEFYKKAFDALEIKRWLNPDGTIHVAELSIGGAAFFLREESARDRQFSPGAVGGVTTLLGLFVEDPDALAARAIVAGAKELNAVRDYDETGYREGSVEDPFGHRWLLIKRIPFHPDFK